uniref:trypsin n=2 Tax=Erpetoichthys calabaricus TaxID=27687 RepID=A0A8C4T3A9_ERPCA
MKVMLVVFWITITAVSIGLAGVSGDKIIDGTEARPHSRPYMAYLDIKSLFKRYACGGFLIHRNFVLTAGHCKGRSINVILGVHNLTKPEPSVQVIKVKNMIRHERYNKKKLENDIMLLKLEKSATLTNDVTIINIPNSTQNFRNGTLCSVAGWGKTASSGYGSNTLREVDVTVQEPCKDPKMICARGTGQKGICNGDSGGPLICPDNNNSPLAVGIVSYSDTKCCEENNRNDVYTMVSAYRSWLDNKMSQYPLV